MQHLTYDFAQAKRKRAMQIARQAQYYWHNSLQSVWKTTMIAAIHDARVANQACVTRKRQWKIN